MRVCLGGTFDPFHVGHEAMLREACRDADAVFVGVTDDALAERPDRHVAPWEERADAVASFIASIGFSGDLEVNRLTDPYGPAATGAYDAIVVSPETTKGADTINAKRKADGLSPLAFRMVPHILADDLLPVSSTRIHAGRIDREGRRLTPVRVAVGSGNPVKLSGVQHAFHRLLPGQDVDVQGHAVDPGVPEQPKEDEIRRGATARAQAALDADPDVDYAVGLEAGLNRDDDGTWYDVQACVVLDRTGLATTGWGPAFQYPGWVTERALAGEMVSDILGPVADDPRIGGTTGAIGFLTDGRYDRTEFTEQAVIMAFAPRIRRGLYQVGPSG